MTERTFTTTKRGLIALRLPAGTARVTVDPSIKTATIRLHTRDTQGPSVDAINQATASTVNGLEVDVPDTGGGGMTVIQTGHGGRYSSVSISGNGSVIVSGGNVTINGQRITGSSMVSSGITADVTVPGSAELSFRSVSADLVANGPLAALTVATTSGDIETGLVGSLAVNSSSGDVEVTGVTEQLTVSTVSGDVEIGSYSGQRATLNAVSGDISLSATPASSGGLSATTVSGDIRLRGAAHLRPYTSSVSGRVRT
jgi:hypothetical protein